MADMHRLEMLHYLESSERRSRIINEDRVSDLDFLDSEDFKSRYRISRSSAEDLLLLLRDNLSSTTMRNNALSPEEKLCIALRFFSSGAQQQILGDLSELSQSSSCRAVNQVALHLAKLRPRYVYLPNEVERREISQKFLNSSGFPGVYGAIDCTHIPIISPGGDYAEIFRNRKGYFSLNVQTISDADLYIRNIVARWPGSTHDSTIFDHSHVRALFEAEIIPPSYHLIGDNGYSCRTYLMTPFLNPTTQMQKR
ncbi:Putative nuclease HARBI1 [Araneus ventricosus]|uniref:Putative nuclease HARBI1 n=1 Tax=Araneus ventricosus TaxID=182803 RepID=A0A4Y2JZH7_ARAVE|nr:Putative nuclease HARBI1 [Araneus ventricosus]